MQRLTFPDPHNYDNWKPWAEDVVRISDRQDGRLEIPVVPTSILLAHLVDAGAYSVNSAATNGILLYDPVDETPVVSYNGNWLPLVHGSPSPAIANATSGNYVATINSILSVLRAFNLIQT